MDELKFISVQEFLEAGFSLDGKTVYTQHSTRKNFWPLGIFRNGKIFSGVISLTLEPKSMYVKEQK